MAGCGAKGRVRISIAAPLISPPHWHAQVEPAAHGLASFSRGDERPLIHSGNDGIVQLGAGSGTTQEGDSRGTPVLRHQDAYDDDLSN